MGVATEIAWCDHTFNCWWGCTKVSPACDFCYAEAFAKRTGHDVWGKDGERRFFGDKHWDEPRKWDQRAAEAGETRRVFCASMADVFEADDRLDIHRERLWDLIVETPNLTWQLLTKRPEQVIRRVPAHWLAAGWPRNIWLGTTVEDDQRARIRIPRLMAVPKVAVRFLSMEPLLGEVDLWPWLGQRYRIGDGDYDGSLSWIICGGESGPHRRPFSHDWARRIRDDCASHDVAFFFKQDSALRPGQPGPDDLMIREFPA